MRKIFFYSALLLLTACAGRQAIPEGYTGPVAVVKETAVRVDSGKAQMFYLSKIDGVHMTDNSASKSFSRSYGKGNNLTIVDTPYEIPAEEHIYTLVGGHVWAMDGRGMFEAGLTVTGDIAFTPVEGRTYLIDGSLSKEVSIVRIKDTVTGEIIAEFEKKDP